MILRRLAIMAGILVFALCVALAGIGYWATHTIISSFSTQLVGHFADDIQDALGAQVGRSQRVLSRVTADITQYDITLDDPRAMRRELYAVLSGEPHIGRLFFANEAGGLVGASRLPDGGLVFLMTDGFRPGVLREYDASSDGQLGPLRQSGPVFDARQRPWYQPAKDTHGWYWTAPYRVPDEFGFRVSLSAPIFDVGGTFAGVIATDLPLTVVTRDIEPTHVIGSQERSFIINSAGRLIASSGGVMPVVREPDGSEQRVLAANTDDPVVRGTARYIQARPAILRQPQDGRTQVFSFNDPTLGEIYAAVVSFQSFGGSAWTIVSAVPASDFLAPARDALTFSVVMSALVVVLALALGSRIAALTLRPLTALTDTARAIARGEWPEIPEVQRNDEIGLLSRAFKIMIASLEETQNGLRLSEAKIRRLVDANIIGIFFFAADGLIIEANDAFLCMIGYDREDLAAGRLRWTDLTPPEWLERDQRRWVPMQRATGILHPFEKEYFRKDGSRVPVLIGVASFDESGDHGVTFVIDLTERKRTEEALRKVQMELAHANRIATMGQLTSSIAHEVSQPVAATVINAQAALRWLGAEPPALEEVRRSLDKIIRDGHRARDVIDRIRALIKKAPPRKDRLDINEAVREVIELTRAETVRNGVTVRTDLADGLPLIEGDRVQLQQVLLNLIMNAVEAMSGASEGARALSISTKNAEPSGVLVAVADSGPGLAPTAAEHLFDAFHTTKPGGLGLGLSICRAITEAHGGRLWVSANVPRGTIFHFTMPAYPGGAA